MKSKDYQEYNICYDDKELPPANILTKIIELVNTSTYHPNILARRVNLLNKSEKTRCDREWVKICESIDKIDDIISTRAEIENDPWKIIK